MSLIGHLVTATSMSIAFMRINEVSWTDGLSSLPQAVLAQPIFDAQSPSAMTLVGLGMILGARGPDRLEIPVFNHRSKKRLSLIPHRTLTHWPVFWLALTITCFYSLTIVQDSFGCAVMYSAIGFCASGWLHLLMDFMTPSGIPLVIPFGKRTSLNVFKTASMGEWMCIFCFVVFNQLLLIALLG